ncbi:MAG: hypothetical protein MR372_08290 [Lachnospiraceae bacterium]|nr:hypothetical protein [Lachnospiraceae bacterium]
MTTKQYLGQIRILDIKIRQRQREAAELKLAATCTGSASAQGEKVQTSASGDKLLNAVARYVDLEAETQSMIDAMQKRRHKIIAEIQDLDDARYIQVLFKRYVEYKKFELIAVEMNYDYNWVKNLHGMALMSFERTYSNILSDKL